MFKLSRAVLLIGCVSAALADTGAYRAGSIETGVFLGSAYGNGDGSFMGGANVSYAVTKMLLPYVEYSYFSGVQRTSPPLVAGTASGLSASFKADASDFHGGVHIRIPIHESPFAPYGVFGIGLLNFGSGTLHTLTFADATGQHTLNNLNIPIAGGNNLAINFGGGVRYYMPPKYGAKINARLGFRAEFKGYKPLNVPASSTGTFGAGTFNNAFLKAEAGFFIQFR